MLKSDVVWPNSRRYKSHSEWEPVGFFSDCLCNATRFDLKLGFFSTSAINVLSDGFAAFLYNGGRMRLIINDVLSQQDKDILNKAGDSSAIIQAISLNDLAKLKETLSERGRHFFDCIAWLIRNNRIEIKIVTPKDSNGISHTKCGLFADATNTFDRIYDRSNFPEAVTACKLPEHHDKKLIPKGKMFYSLVSFMSFYNAVKNSFRKKTDELTEYVFARIHACPILFSAVNMENQFKLTRGFLICI